MLDGARWWKKDRYSRLSIDLSQLCVLIISNMTINSQAFLLCACIASEWHFKEEECSLTLKPFSCVLV